MFLLAVGSIPVASLAVGAVLDTAGAPLTFALLGAAMLATTLGGLASRTIARAPRTSP